jgi:hypothetical protein
MELWREDNIKRNFRWKVVMWIELDWFMTNRMADFVVRLMTCPFSFRLVSVYGQTPSAYFLGC